MDLRQYFILTVIFLKTLIWSYSSALVQGKDSNGKSIFAGKRFTGFSNAEEKAHGLPVEVGGRHINVLQRECALTSNAPLGHRFLVRGQDQGARREIRECRRHFPALGRG